MLKTWSSIGAVSFVALLATACSGRLELVVKEEKAPVAKPDPTPPTPCVGDGEKHPNICCKGDSCFAWVDDPFRECPPDYTSANGEQCCSPENPKACHEPPPPYPYPYPPDPCSDSKDPSCYPPPKPDPYPPSEICPPEFHPTPGSAPGYVRCCETKPPPGTPPGGEKCFEIEVGPPPPPEYPGSFCPENLEPAPGPAPGIGRCCMPGSNYSRCVVIDVSSLPPPPVPSFCPPDAFVDITQEGDLYCCRKAPNGLVCTPPGAPAP